MPKKAKKRAGRVWTAPPLTLQWIKAHSPCNDQERMFYNRFGTSTPVTLAKCLRVALMTTEKLNLKWALDNLLEGAQCHVVASDARLVAAWKDYQDKAYTPPRERRLRIAQARAFFKAWHTQP